MTRSKSYSPSAPARDEVEGSIGVTVLEFGTDWCGYCMQAQPVIDAGLAAEHELTHLKIEDGKGRALGRSFQVKLWPTLVFLRDGKEVARVVRPTRADEVAAALARTR
jgi:thioredoxin 1